MIIRSIPIETEEQFWESIEEQKRVIMEVLEAKDDRDFMSVIPYKYYINEEANRFIDNVLLSKPKNIR